MQEVAIVTDSATDITADMARELGILIAPVHVIIDDVDYRDRVDMPPEEFYARLPTLPAIPTTSGANVQDFLECYQRGLEMAESIVCITIPSTLSVCLTSARSARELLLMDVPEADVTVVDSHTATTPQALMLIAAARLAQEGKGKEEILSLVEGLIPKVDMFFTPDTIEYLDKGGRLTATEQVVGSLQGFRPIIRVKDDRIMPVDRAETREASIARILELMEEQVGAGAEVMAGVVHAMVPEEAAALRETVETRFTCREMHTFVLGPTAGTHFGPGTIGVGFHPVG
jgi:DegV family protein with EDD domain